MTAAFAPKKDQGTIYFVASSHIKGDLMNPTTTNDTATRRVRRPISGPYVRRQSRKDAKNQEVLDASLERCQDYINRRSSATAQPSAN
jgi:hypothetical protein